MLPDASAAFQVFVAGAVAILAATLFLAGRRRPEGVLLVVFLGLVGFNFAATALDAVTQDSRWARVATVATGLDAYFLLAFVSLHPFPRRTPAVRALLAGVGAAGVAVAFLAVLDGPAGGESALASGLASANLAVAYGAAWFLAVLGAVHGPSPQLRRRAAWLVAAVGVAVVPRLALVPQDFRLRSSLAEEWAWAVVGAAVMAALLLAAWRWAGRTPGGRSAGLRGALALVAGFSALVAALLLARGWLAGAGVNVTLAWPYGLRWVVFGGILVQGLLAYEVLEPRRSLERTLALAGASVGALAALLGTAAFAGMGGIPEAVAWPLAFGVAAATSVPSWMATRGLARAAEARRPPPDAERRLTLYQAALEAAWAGGPPDPAARHLLEADRRAFGVSVEEARALEHVVSGSLAPGPERLRPGDEAATGLVVEEQLGEGAHGRVFRARRYPAGERVVVKEMHPDAARGREARQRLLRELRALQRLDHPGIVRLLDVAASGGRHLLVMEHVDGPPLSQALLRGSWSPRRVRSVVGEVLDALETAHARGVVHGDVKPANILLGSDGRPRLADFGLARLHGGEERVKATATGRAALGGADLEGTLAYMAPEQVEGGPAVPASDLYAVGLVAYEALVGRPALDLRGCGLLAAVDRVARPRIALDAAPPAWRAWFARALAPDPARRFASAGEMRRALPGQ